MDASDFQSPLRGLCSRRHFLQAGSAFGLGSTALAWLLQHEGLLGAPARPELEQRAYDLKPKSGHHPARARAMISILMIGGPSQMDLFDPKPLLKQWAGKPFVWHIYRQTMFEHEAKLSAFLRCQGASYVQRDFWHTWNGVSGSLRMDRAWRAYLDALPALRKAARAWPARLAGHGDLAGNLLNFCKKLL